MSKLTVGTKVYLKPIQNYAHRIRNRVDFKDKGMFNFVDEGTITKVGRKYFYVAAASRFRNLKFEIESLEQVTDYVPDFSIYFSKEQVLEEIKKEELLEKLYKRFYRLADMKYLSLDQIERILAILDEDQKIDWE